MGSDFSAIGFSPADAPLPLASNAYLFSSYVVAEILGQFVPPGSNREIKARNIRRSRKTQLFQKGRPCGTLEETVHDGALRDRKRFYGVIPGVPIFPAADGGWSEAITASGNSKEEVCGLMLARTLCAPLIKGMARVDYQAGAYIRIDSETPGESPEYFQLTTRKAHPRELAYAPEEMPMREITLTREIVGRMTGRRARAYQASHRAGELRPADGNAGKTFLA